MVYFFMFLSGGIGYNLMEIFWRGYTHWTMGLAGGISFLSIYMINNYFGEFSLFLRSLLGALSITLVEFVFGLIFNLKLKWNIWDYSDMMFHVKGQICLPYSLLWFCLCLVLFPLCDFIDETILEKFI